MRLMRPANRSSRLYRFLVGRRGLKVALCAAIGQRSMRTIVSTREARPRNESALWKSLRELVGAADGSSTFVGKPVGARSYTIVTGSFRKMRPDAVGSGKAPPLMFTWSEGRIRVGGGRAASRA